MKTRKKLNNCHRTMTTTMIMRRKEKTMRKKKKAMRPKIKMMRTTLP
jgi:hypothetical protein